MVTYENPISFYLKCNYCGKPSAEEITIGKNLWKTKLYIKKNRMEINFCKEHANTWLKYVDRKKGDPVLWEYSFEFMEMMR